MSYTPAEYENAKRELEKRRTEAEKLQQAHHDEALKKIPMLKEIEQEMAKAGLSVIKALGMGKDAVKYVKELEKISLEAQKKRAELLAENGFPEDYLKVKYHCPICEDKGIKDGKMCSCCKLILRNAAYKKLNSKFPLDKYTFEKFDVSLYPDTGDGTTPRKRMETILQFCKNYANDFSLSSPGILMQGDTGLGKTHLSLAIAGKVIKRGYGVIYASTQNILNRLEKEKFGRVQDTETEKNLLECDLLILDDLGTEFSTQFSVSAVYNIINSRLLSSKPTIISTNLNLKQLEDLYSSRVVSRLSSDYKILRFYGTDIRTKLTR